MLVLAVSSFMVSCPLPWLKDANYQDMNIHGVLTTDVHFQSTHSQLIVDLYKAWDIVECMEDLYKSLVFRYIKERGDLYWDYTAADRTVDQLRCLCTLKKIVDIYAMGKCSELDRMEESLDSDKRGPFKDGIVEYVKKQHGQVRNCEYIVQKVAELLGAKVTDLNHALAESMEQSINWKCMELDRSSRVDSYHPDKSIDTAAVSNGIELTRREHHIDEIEMSFDLMEVPSNSYSDLNLPHVTCEPLDKVHCGKPLDEVHCGKHMDEVHCGKHLDEVHCGKNLDEVNCSKHLDEVHHGKHMDEFESRQLYHTSEPTERVRTDKHLNGPQDCFDFLEPIDEVIDDGMALTDDNYLDKHTYDLMEFGKFEESKLRNEDMAELTEDEDFTQELYEELGIEITTNENWSTEAHEELANLEDSPVYSEEFDELWNVDGIEYDELTSSNDCILEGNCSKGSPEELANLKGFHVGMAQFIKLRSASEDEELNSLNDYTETECIEHGREEVANFTSTSEYGGLLNEEGMEDKWAEQCDEEFHVTEEVVNEKLYGRFSINHIKASDDSQRGP